MTVLHKEPMGRLDPGTDEKWRMHTPQAIF